MCFIAVGVYYTIFAGLAMLKPWVQAGGELEETGVSMALRTGPMSHGGAPGGSGAAAAPGRAPPAYADRMTAADKRATDVVTRGQWRGRVAAAWRGARAVCWCFCSVLGLFRWSGAARTQENGKINGTVGGEVAQKDEAAS
jgi:hypothetical protein